MLIISKDRITTKKGKSRIPERFTNIKKTLSIKAYSTNKK